MTSPGIVLKSKFVMPGTKGFNNYLNYIDRDDAKVKQHLTINRESEEPNDFEFYHTFMDYMDDKEKQGELFTDSKDELTDDEKLAIKNKFQLAQKNGSPMWQDVFSFDNEWLEKQGLYIPNTHFVNEEKLKNCVREGMNEMLKAEKMEGTATWSGTIHYNTDNIHVHVASVETMPTREKRNYYDNKKGEWKEQYRGKRKPKTLEKMKSKVANTIMDRSHERNKIDDLIREAVKDKKENMRFSGHRKTKKLFLQALNKMPDDKRQWKYGYASVDNARPYIDELSNIYLERFHKKDLNELSKQLDAEVLVMKETYGEGSNHEKYKQTKLDDLKKRMGNAVITEMRAYDKKEKAANYQKQTKLPTYQNKSGMYSHKSNLNYSMIQLNVVMRKTFHEYQKDRNIDEFDRMLDGYE